MQKRFLGLGTNLSLGEPKLMKSFPLVWYPMNVLHFVPCCIQFPASPLCRISVIRRKPCMSHSYTYTFFVSMNRWMKILLILETFLKIHLLHQWQFHYHRDNDERSADMRDLVTSFSGLEDKVLDQYTFAKVWLAMEDFLLINQYMCDAWT